MLHNDIQNNVGTFLKNIREGNLNRRMLNQFELSMAQACEQVHQMEINASPIPKERHHSENTNVVNINKRYSQVRPVANHHPTGGDAA